MELLRSYENNRYPNAIEKASIANALGLSTEFVHNWYRHQREKERKKLASNTARKYIRYLSSCIQEYEA